eukprot:scaffold250721_cov43-Attheya_sp.AAC.1
MTHNMRGGGGGDDEVGMKNDDSGRCSIMFILQLDDCGEFFHLCGRFSRRVRRCRTVWSVVVLVLGGMLFGCDDWGGGGGGDGGSSRAPSQRSRAAIRFLVMRAFFPSLNN